MNHSVVIQSIISAMSNVKSYLELGIYEGETFEKIRPLVGRCIGVDIVDKRKIKLQDSFCLCSTETFFATNEELFDAIFIDADHEFEQLKKDLLLSLNILNENGIIFIHDTDPSKKELLDPGFCGDSYKIIKYLERYQPSLSVMTLPICDPGLSIIRRKKDKRVLRWSR